jgi:hypothetical protein
MYNVKYSSSLIIMKHIYSLTSRLLSLHLHLYQLNPAVCRHRGRSRSGRGGGCSAGTGRRGEAVVVEGAGAVADEATRMGLGEGGGVHWKIAVCRYGWGSEGWVVTSHYLGLSRPDT